MFNLRNVVIDANGTLGSKKLLVDVIPVYEYVNDKRTDKILAHRYVIALPERSFEKRDFDGDRPRYDRRSDSDEGRSYEKKGFNDKPRYERHSDDRGSFEKRDFGDSKPYPKKDSGKSSDGPYKKKVKKSFQYKRAGF